MTSVADGQAILAEAFETCHRIVALTGAGVSTECGVPDFRSPGSPWLLYPPLPFAAFLASADARVEAWRRKFAMDDIYAGARPGRTHRALAAMGAAGQLNLVITQNIDGLHTEAGLPPERLVELHGNGTYATCLSCGARHDLAIIRVAFDRDREAPTCTCGGMVKSATIAFGQALSPEPLATAHHAALNCDLFLVLGSSLLVRPAARLPSLAAQRDARLIIVNREPTPLDAAADAIIRADVGDVMAPWIGACDAAPYMARSRGH